MIGPTCPTCGALSPAPPYDAVAESARVLALANAAGCTPATYTPAVVWAHGLALDGITPAALAASKSKAAEAAHDAALAAGKTPQEAWNIAAAVRAK